MTTLHRFGSAESFDDDFIVFAMACKGPFKYAGIPRHSVGYSLGFEGKTEKMPNGQVMMLSTMCGHSKRILEDARTKVS